MIPARSTCYATVTIDPPDPDGTSARRFRIEAWSPEGEPMIVDPEHGQTLVSARTLPGFMEVDGDLDSEITAVVPGDGWKVEFSVQGVKRVCPVIAWAIDPKGRAVPIVVDEGTGVGRRLEQSSMRAIPPAER